MRYKTIATSLKKKNLNKLEKKKRISLQFNIWMAISGPAQAQSSLSQSQLSAF